MKIASRHPFVFGTALFIAAAAGLYGCKDFLEKAAEPQGTLDETTLATKSHCRVPNSGLHDLSVSELGMRRQQLGMGKRPERRRV